MTGSVEDRLAIRELCESFGDAVMRRDAEAWAATWAAGAVWGMAPGVEIRGREAIVEKWRSAMGALDFCAFIGMQGPLAIDGARARGVYYRQETLYFKNGDARILLGRYNDEYARCEGRWRIASRVSETLRERVVKARD